MLASFGSRALAVACIVASAGAPSLAQADGFLDQADCDGLRGWAADPADKTNPIDVKLTFDAAASDPGTVQHPVLANAHRDDLCASVGCEHGFQATLPLSLYDGFEHTVHAYESDGADGVGAELMTSPKTFTCPLALPSGVKRKVAGDEAMAAWHWSPFWDEISVSDGILSAYGDGAPVPASPEVVFGISMPDALFVIDVARDKKKVKRALPDGATAEAWEFFASQATSEADTDLAATPDAQPMRARPFVLRAADGTLYLIDDDPTAGAMPAGGGGAGGEGGGTTGPLSESTCSCREAGSPAGGDRGAAIVVASAIAVAFSHTRRARKSRLRER